MKVYLHCINKFGLPNALKIIFSHLGKSKRIYVSQISQYLFARPDSSDFDTFLQIFFKEEYSIPLKGEVRTIVDAGANNGYAARFFHQKYPHAQIISIEPEHDNFQILTKNVDGIHLIEPIHAALCGGQTKTSMRLGAGQGWTRRVEPDDLGEITGYSIPAILKEFNLETIDLLKIDIEGGEFHVFDSESIKWLPKVKNIIIELHDRWVPGSSRAFFKAINRFDYTLNLYGENVIIEFNH